MARSRPVPQPLQAFCAMLRELRLAAGQPTLAVLRAAMPHRPGLTTLSDILNAKIVTAPEWRLVEEFVTACAITTSRTLPPKLVDVDLWKRRHADLERIVEAISRHTRGISSTAAVALTRTLPHDLPDFTGRHDEIERLRASAHMASSGAAVGIISVDGMAGVGKTALVLHAAHQLADLFPDGQLFLELRGHTPGQSPVAPADALGVLLRMIGADPRAVPNNVDERAALWRDRVAGRRILLVLDDAWDHNQVKPLLPGAPGCCVLITSRRRIAALAGATAMSLTTPVPHDAVELFVRLAPTTASQARDVAELVRLVGFLPLAIRLLAGRLRNRPAWSVADLVHELAATQNRSDAIYAEDVVISAAFSLSYRALPEHAQLLFSRIGLYPGTDFDANVAAVLCADLQGDVRRSLDTLYDNHLIEEPVRGRYQLHDLLRDFGRKIAGSESRKVADALLDRLFGYYITVAGEADGLIRGAAADSGVSGLRSYEQAMAWLRTELANMCACAEAASTPHNLWVVRLGRTLRAFLRRQAYWGQAETLHRKARAAAHQIGDRTAEALSLFDVGAMWRIAGDHMASIESYGEALSIFEELGHGIGTADVLQGLGIVYARMGEYGRAESSMSRAMALYEDHDDAQALAITLHELGKVRGLTGDYAGALERQKRALEAYQQFGDQVRAAGVRLALGTSQYRTGDYAAAEVSLTTALEIYRQTEHRGGQAEALDQLGLLSGRTGDLNAAVDRHASALAIYETLGNRRGQAEALNNLGAATRARDPEMAMGHHRKALSLARMVLSQLEEARACEGLGACLVDIHEINDGVTYLQQSLDIYQRIGSPDAERVIAALSPRTRK